MTTLEMYDAVNPASIPDDAPAVARYIDGAYAWPEAQVRRFAHVPNKLITVTGSLEATAFDIEPGNPDATKGAIWVKKKLAQGDSRNDTALYTSRVGVLYYGWASCTIALRQLGIPTGANSWWIADQTGTAHLVPGSDATQYTDTGSVDISLADADWLGVANPVPEPTPPTNESDDEMFPTNPTQPQFNVNMRFAWYLFRKDLPTGTDFDAYWYAWNVPITQNGFGNDWDLVVARIHDTAGTNLK